MLALAAEHADGAIVTWASPDDVARVAAELGPRPPGWRLVVWVTVAVDDDPEIVRRRARSVISRYLSVPSYAGFVRWLGHGDDLTAMWAAAAAGDWPMAEAAIGDDVVDRLIVHGSADDCRRRLAEYAAAGATDIAVCPQPGTTDPMAVYRAVAPLPSTDGVRSWT